MARSGLINTLERVKVRGSTSPRWNHRRGGRGHLLKSLLRYLEPSLRLEEIAPVDAMVLNLKVSVREDQL